MNYFYGPIPLRRLRQSLGIDPIQDLELRLLPTRPKHTNDQHAPRVHPIRGDHGRGTGGASASPSWHDRLDQAVGSAEPTLHTGLGRMSRELKALTTTSVSVITNGSLLYLREVREDLCGADIVLPTVVAGGERLYCQIVRRWRRLTFARTEPFGARAGEGDGALTGNWGHGTAGAPYAGVARALIDTAHALKLIGCKVVLSSVSSDVAMTLTHLNITLDDITTARNPQEALMAESLSARADRN